MCCLLITPFAITQDIPKSIQLDVCLYTCLCFGNCAKNNALTDGYDFFPPPLKENRNNHGKMPRKKPFEGDTFHIL